MPGQFWPMEDCSTTLPGKWIRFRLLKYMCRIWDASFQEQPDQTELRPILPVVFYQGERTWRHSIEFADLFPAGERDHSFLPRFAHYLIDQSELVPEAVQGGLKARVAQLLLLAAFHPPVRAALANAVHLVAQIKATGITPSQFQALKEQLRQMPAVKAVRDGAEQAPQDQYQADGDQPPR